MNSIVTLIIELKLSCFAAFLVCPLCFVIFIYCWTEKEIPHTHSLGKLTPGVWGLNYQIWVIVGSKKWKEAHCRYVFLTGLPFTLVQYFCRYMDCNKEETRRRREASKKLKEQLLLLQAKLDKWVLVTASLDLHFGMPISIVEQSRAFPTCNPNW